MNRERAKKLVARQTHEAASYYNSVPSFIKPYTDELDGLYFGIGPKGTTRCIAVWKGELKAAYKQAEKMRG